MRPAIDTANIKGRNDLRTFAERYTHLDRTPKSQERHGACPICGGSNRFYVGSDYCGCRQCGWRTDIFGLVMRVERVKFLEAVEMIAGEKLPERQPAQPVAQHVQRRDDDNERRAYFLANAPAFTECSQKALTSGDNPGAFYLRGRGLEPGTWSTYGLGYTEHPIGVASQWDQPCIVIPWYAGGKLQALRYRYLEAINYTDEHGKAKLEKAHACAGSKTFGFVYGGQALPELVVNADGVRFAGLPYRTLVLVEGELNAASIYQVCHAAHVDVLSIGGQGHAIPPFVVDMAKHYRAVLVWLDEEEFVTKKLETLGRSFGFWSTPKGGKKADANDHLQRGTLRSVMVKLLRSATPAAQQERLQWDLEDGGLVSA